MSVLGVILVHIFPPFSRIRTEYGEIRSISPYSVRMREKKCGPEKLRMRTFFSSDAKAQLLTEITYLSA